ncbi:MAG: hypothetical protein ACI8W8_001245 [Rhodothermales bacterium]
MKPAAEILMTIVEIRADRRANLYTVEKLARIGKTMTNSCFGITVMPEYIQSEGIDPVLDRLQELGVNQVATSPYLMLPAAEGEGHREPPIDAGAGKLRLLDRPLWGKRELWFRITPSFRPNPARYRGLRYQPPPCEQPSDLLHRFVAAAKSRGISPYFQIQAAIPPNLRVQFGGPTDEDLPLLPNGLPPEPRLSKNASLASPEILAYTQALSTDLIEQYPDICGLRYDWPEYPCYHYQTAFTDFNPQAEFADLRAQMQAILDARRFEFPPEFLARKATLVSRFNRALAVTCHALDKEIILHAFPPPFNQLTGFDFAANSASADGIGMKLYTMHLPMILRNFGLEMAGAESAILRQLNDFFDLNDTPLDSLDAYTYPPPDQAHQVSCAAQVRKIRAAAAESANLHTMVHTYGPTADFAGRLALAREHSPNGIWLNRYAYLDDAKFASCKAASTR